MRTRIAPQKVDVAKATKKAERQRFLYGQAVSGIMKELSCTWSEAKKELKSRQTINSISRDIENQRDLQF